MKRKIIFGILGLVLLIGIVGAGILGSLDKSIDLTKEQKTALESVHLNNYETSDYTIGTEQIKRCLDKIYNNQSVMGTCQIFDTYWMDDDKKMYHSSSEMLDIMNAWEKQRMENIADTTIIRQNKGNETKTAEGTTTITEKK